MKKKNILRQSVALILILSMIFSWYTPTVMAASMTDIRVGLTNLYRNKAALKIKTTKIGMGYSIQDRFISETAFSSSTGFTFQVAKGDYYILEQSFQSYNDAMGAVKKIEKLGVKAYPVSIYRETWKVYVGGYNSKGELEEAKKLLGTAYGYSYQGPYADNGHRILMMGENLTVLLDGKTFGAYPQFKAVSVSNNKKAILNLGKRQYRGRIEIGRYGKSALSAVNIINIESYLYSVVPSEMTSSWPTESLKAQAVCARSYALSKADYGTDSNITSPYRITDTTSYQSYKGYGVETTATTAAVNATRGFVITYQGDIISSYYFSTSGGRTESSYDVWGSSAPYLTSVIDEYETEPEKGPWVIAMTKSEIARRLSNAGMVVGNVKKITVQSKTASNRINQLKITGDYKAQVLQTEQIRKILELYSTKFKIVTSSQNTDQVVALSSSGKTKVELSDSYVINGDGKISELNQADQQIYVVKSSDNLATFIKDGPTSKDVYYFVGLGYGHGVGMSQSGAKGLAKHGYSYIEILQYYFQGCSVEYIN